MKKVVLFFAVAFVCNGLFAQVNKTWVGASNALWSVAGNWSPAGVPVATDTVILNSSNNCTVDINPTVAALKALGLGNSNGFINSSGIAKTITITSNPATSPVLYVEAGSNFILGAGGSTAGVSISTYGAAGTNNTALVDGTMYLAYSSTWDVANGTAVTTVTISNTGWIDVPGPHTAINVFANSTTANLKFLSGSTLRWGRNGGNIPAADYQSGSTINITGISSTMVALSSAATYSGLLIWNCGAQTISGSSAVLLPTVSYAMDSIRVMSTGSGSLRISTEPVAYILGHVEVQGGTLEMSAPIISNKTGSITTDLKIGGGIVIGNASFIGEGAVGTPMTLSVGGKLTMTGGILDLTNRPVGVGGAFQLNVAGDVVVTAGTVTATSAFGSQNQIVLNGSTTQNVILSTFSGAIGLVINNTSATGVTLSGALTIPSTGVVNLLTGVISTTATNILTFASGALVFGASNNSFVDGPVKKIGNTTFTFPIGKTNCGVSANVKGYVALTISNFTGSTVTDAFTAEYKRGALNPYNISNGGIHHVSVCDYWTLTRDNGTPLVNITLSWDNPINNCLSTKPYIDELASLVVVHNNNIGASPWDAVGSIGTFTGSTTTGTISWAGTQSGTFGAFTIGSVNFNNPLPINLNYITGTKLGSSNLINWKVTCSNNNPTATMSLEHSIDGRNFTTTITSITADALRCQQPFNYTDIDPATGMNYYRLKMVDANGKVSYSTMIGILNATKGFDIVNLVPNLVTANAVLNVSAAQKTQMDIVIRDMAGKQLQKIRYNLVAGSNQFTMNLGNLNAAMYSITGYTSDGSSKTIRFVKN
jgi:hypothetical protein